jgi:hypothetical protein
VIAAWVMFPALLSALALGCGLAVDAACARRLPRSLIPVCGLAALIVVGGFTTMTEATAEWTVPACVTLALAGLALGFRRLGPRGAGWGIAAAAAIFAVYAAPIVLSGDPTIAGYIRLDDTATWLALTDRVMEHGRDLGGLAPSTYEATLDFNLARGYPVGGFLPLGTGARLAGTDVAWLIQPYMAWLAAVLALCLWGLVRPLVESERLRALAAVIAAQAALLFGYYLWGGIKEVAAAALVAGAAACVGHLAGQRFAWRALLPAAITAAAIAAVLAPAGLIWLVPAGLAALVLGARALAPRVLAARAVPGIGLVALLALPALATGRLTPPTSARLDDPSAEGNLAGPLEPSQIAGIWPAGDFRFDPTHELLASALIALAILLAGGGLALAVRRRAWGLVVYAAGAVAVALVLDAVASPWAAGKALAIASPAVPLAAAAGAAVALGARPRALGAVALALLAGGVVWSNALAYRDVNLAPYGQLSELERIGEAISGQGPTLITEYQPYGARHFLRDADPEAASELRRRVVPLAGGGVVEKGDSADTDALDPAGLYAYRTLVLRRSPAQSRPPAAYRLTSRGAYYEVWQRRPDRAPLDPRLALGSASQPVGRPPCARLRAFASRATSGDRLVAAARPPAVVVPLARAAYPRRWRAPGHPSQPVPDGSGTIEARVRIDRAGGYTVWLRGSIRPRAELRVDGHAAGSVRDQLQNGGEYVRLGHASLDRGPHDLEIEFADADLHPGSGGAPTPVGPLVLSAADAGDARLLRLGPARADLLCGRPLDWVEIDEPRAG